MNKKAFSLLELSVVLVIIGVLLAGIIQSRNMIDSSRLAAARSLTEKSPVKHISNLILWYETSLDESFVNSEISPNGAISTWKDLSEVENHATQGTLDNQPLYVPKAVYGSIPSVRFDGSNDYFDFDGTSFVYTNYTLFVVAQRLSSTARRWIGGTRAGTNSSLLFGWWNSTGLSVGHYGEWVGYTIGEYSAPELAMHSYTMDTTNGKRYWFNGGSSPDNSSSSQKNQLTRFDGSAIAKSFNDYFHGDIAEIIGFNRRLKDKERQEIEGYLSRKYGITIEE